MKFVTRFAFALTATLFFGLASSGFAAAETYTIQPAHSSVGFSVRHFFTKVPGSFAKFEGTIVVDRENLERSTVSATIAIPSVSTNDAKRDEHLQNDDFFLAQKFPAAAFKSTSWKRTGPDTYDVAGDLTIKGITKPVVLKTKILGFGPGSRGAQLAGFEATTTLDRRDFGLAYGQGVVGNEVELQINIESVKS